MDELSKLCIHVKDNICVAWCTKTFGNDVGKHLYDKYLNAENVEDFILMLDSGNKKRLFWSFPKIDDIDSAVHMLKQCCHWFPHYKLDDINNTLYKRYEKVNRSIMILWPDMTKDEKEGYIKIYDALQDTQL